jgi:hypothetical protein
MMSEEKIVQFVVFETALDSNAFLDRWKQYQRSVNDKVSVTLQQQVIDNGKFRYISQHKCPSDEFHFVFEKDRRGIKTHETAVRQKLAGGYTALQLDHNGETKANESKIIVFVLDARTNLDDFRQFSVHGKLNIYEAYYENCEFAYILEFFVKNEYASDVLTQLKILTSFAEAGIYKECHA